MKTAVKLAHIQNDQVISVFADASDRYWGGMVTQTELENSEKNLEDQEARLLAFLGAQFNRTQRNWTTYEKEAYAIVKMFENMDHGLWGPNQVQILMGHRYLLYVLAPLALRQNLPRYVLSKTHLWVIYLSRFNFVIEYIGGAKNIFTDLLTRRAKGYRTVKTECSNITEVFEGIVPSTEELKVHWIA